MKIENKEIEFFDGETVNNKYVLLGSSENYIIDKKGLSLENCLDFLFTEGKHNNYFFRISYDFNMFFAKEKYSENNIKVFHSETVIIFGYEVTYFSNKILIIKKEKTTKKFFDVSNFFKKSFIKTLDILQVPISKKQLDFLNKYKNLRQGFDINDLKNITEYNKLECILGLKIVSAIYELIPSDLKTLSLYGASAITNKFLSKNEIDKTNNYLKYYNQDKFLLTYFGGRMESLKIGTFKNVYKYDINSAYPNEIKDLREITGITEKKYNKEKIKYYNIYYCELKINDKNLIGLLPSRLKSGYIVFSNEVKNWFYGAEIIEVLEYEKRYDLNIKIKKYLDIELGEKIFNKKQIENLFFKRNIFKKKNDLRNFVYKILLNSIYGKFAQQIGNARFQNIYYAGLITSLTRSKLLHAVIDNPYDVIFFATDGILTKTKLNKLNISENLGDWEEIKIKKSRVLLSGVYECIDFNNKKYLGERGFNFDFDKTFKDCVKFGKSEIKQNIFIGFNYYYKNKKAFSGYKCKFREITKVLNPSNQLKRIYLNKFTLEKENNSFILSATEIKQLDNKLTENHFKEEIYD